MATQVPGASCPVAAPTAPAAAAPARPAAPRRPLPDYPAVTGQASGLAYIARLSDSLPTDDVPAAKVHIARGLALLAAGGMNRDTTARVHLLLSGAYGRAAELGDSQMSNGRNAFFEASKAFEGGSHLADVAVAYSRTVAAFTGLNWGERRIVEAGVGISIKNQSLRAAKALAAFPNDAYAVVTRVRLAAYNGDKAEIAAAEAARTALAARNPNGVASAQRQVDRDIDYKKKQKPAGCS